MIGTAKILDLSHLTDTKITSEDIERYTPFIERGDIVLLKTKNSYIQPTAKFQKDFVYVTETAARRFVEWGVKAVGIDYLGIERDQPLHLTHKLLLGNNIAIIEGLRLAHCDETKCVNTTKLTNDEQTEKVQIICLPLAINGLEGAPARAILLITAKPQ